MTPSVKRHVSVVGCNQYYLKPSKETQNTKVNYVMILIRGLGNKIKLLQINRHITGSELYKLISEMLPVSLQQLRLTIGYKEIYPTH